MMNQSFTTSYSVDQTPEEAFAAITNVRDWWSGDIEGNTAKLNDEFTYRYKDIHYSKQRLTEVVPNRRVVWKILDSYLSFAEDKAEWTGTQVIFEVTPKNGKTEVRFTHLGLVPEFECFENCSTAWGYYINTSLRNLISSGKGSPNPKES